MIAQHFIYETYKPETLMEAFKEAAALWKKNGAKEVSLWRLQGSQINHFSFSVRCDSMEEMGKCMDALSTDADFQAWQMKHFGNFKIKENVIGRKLADG